MTYNGFADLLGSELIGKGMTFSRINGRTQDEMFYRVFPAGRPDTMNGFVVKLVHTNDAETPVIYQLYGPVIDKRAKTLRLNVSLGEWKTVKGGTVSLSAKIMRSIKGFTEAAHKNLERVEVLPIP